LFFLIATFAAIELVMAGVTGSASDASQREQVQLITWRYQTVQASLNGEQLVIHLAQMNNPPLQSDPSGTAAYKAKAEADIKLIESEIALIAALSLPSDAEPVRAKDASAFRDLLTFANGFIAAGRVPDDVMVRQLQGAFDSWRSGRSATDEYIRVKIQEITTLNEARQAATNNVTMIADIGTTIGLVVLAFYMFFLILRPVVKLANVATKLAAENSGTIEPTRRRDEFGQLSGALAAWQRSSQNLVDGLRDGSSRAAASASGLLSASEQLAAATAEQTSATTATAASMEDLARTSTAIADTLGTVASQTIETRDNLERAHAATQTSGARSQALADRVHEINQIVALINEVADQTSLLALNAAIEAARAGEAGRGFAVVADEVRRLAERSKSSAAQITAIIGSAESESNATVMAMEQGAKRMQDSLTLFGNMVEASNKVKVLTQQQLSATELVAQALERITLGSRQVSATAQKISTAAASNALLASEMEEMSQHGARRD
jgi:methyl-accepting chemotaxis protein